jgi:hypothetical protein
LATEGVLGVLFARICAELAADAGILSERFILVTLPPEVPPTKELFRRAGLMSRPLFVRTSFGRSDVL